jgi:hypothetical protein
MNGATFSESVMCELTHDERLFKGEELAQYMLQLDQLDDEKKRVCDDIKARASEADDKARELARQLREGKVWRDVECFESPDYDLGQVNIVSKEDGRVVRVRTMRPEERQQPITYGDGTTCAPPVTPKSKRLKSSGKQPRTDSDLDGLEGSDEFKDGLQ